MTSQAKQASTAQLSSPPFYKASRDSQGNRASPEPALPSLVTELHTARTPSTAFRLNRGLPDFQWSGASFDTDRETCHAAFVKVLQGISSFREKVQAAAEGRSQDPLVQQILSLADALENETKAALAGAGFDEMPAHFPPSSQVVPSLAYRGTSPERSYESMRQALQEMQKRSDNLLARIHKESEANLELSKARTGAEETSRKLSEQVTQQTEELNKLVGQRLKAEQQLEDVRQRSRIEAELREEDFQRKLAAAHKEADERCHAMQKGLVDKLHLTQRAMEKVKTDFHRLRADHADSRKAVLILNEAMSQLMGQTERNISQRVEALVKSSIEQRVLASDVNRELESLELRVLAEQELRSNEVASLRQRYSALEQERDQLQATFTNDVARLSLQLEDDQRRKLEESEKLKAEELRSEAKQQAFTEEAQELLRCRDIIERMKLLDTKQTEALSSQEQELLKCRDLIQHLKSESAEQSAATFRQQQELDCLRVEIVEKQTAARGLAEERDQLLATEAMQLVVISQRAEELQKCRDDLERLKSEGMEYSAMTGQQAQEILHQKKEIQRLHGELTLKEAVVARFEEARTDLALSENQRHLLLEQRRASSKGLNALHMQLESHILRLQKHSDELRGEFRR